MKKAIAGIGVGSIITIAGGTFASLEWADARYASQQQHQQLEQQVECQKLTSSLRAAQDERYFYRGQKRKAEDDPEIHRRLIETEADIHSIRQRMNEVCK